MYSSLSLWQKIVREPEYGREMQEGRNGSHRDVELLKRKVAGLWILNQGSHCLSQKGEQFSKKMNFPLKQCWGGACQLNLEFVAFIRDFYVRKVENLGLLDCMQIVRSEIKLQRI